MTGVQLKLHIRVPEIHVRKRQRPAGLSLVRIGEGEVIRIVTA
jgi:hypothetical protein